MKKRLLFHSNLIYLHCLRFDRLTTNTMYALNILLFDALWRNESHGWTLNRFTDRLGIRSVVLVRLHE
uniref:Uncharacterized protein n=1 Tax=Candidatus Kentrum sp. MB TaxID=2138164 RepID=A0A450XJ52_9GAMM|nr:MAG: hypothetical protein BECKMB1821G_GA0114241_104717 [Candidatus Kentron sp. MB]VFK35218.1 MAG: hypothetical protein BECKMB1821I_GA0114274_11053 [Candidatus Kentron sp. MB]VFK77173.1 MAG: hypothetical protein BECKMB1821H_GA0114242_11063 [Candidatus Kentron sp. MB]